MGRLIPGSDPPTQFPKHYCITHCTDACVEMTIPRDWWRLKLRAPCRIGRSGQLLLIWCRKGKWLSKRHYLNDLTLHFPITSFIYFLNRTQNIFSIASITITYLYMLYYCSICECVGQATHDTSCVSLAEINLDEIRQNCIDPHLYVTDFRSFVWSHAFLLWWIVRYGGENKSDHQMSLMHIVLKA